MRRSRYLPSLIAAAALAAPMLASAGPRHAVTALAGAGSWASDVDYHGRAYYGLGDPGGPWSSALPADEPGLVVDYLGAEPFSVSYELYPAPAFRHENGVFTDLDTVMYPASGWTTAGAG
jgi:hypothetical protein